MPTRLLLAFAAVHALHAPAAFVADAEHWRQQRMPPGLATALAVACPMRPREEDGPPRKERGEIEVDSASWASDVYARAKAKVGTDHRGEVGGAGCEAWRGNGAPRPGNVDP